MGFDIHPLMQDAHDVDLTSILAVEDEMRADGVLSVALAKIGRTTTERLFRQEVQRIEYGLDVAVGLSGRPVVGGLAPNVFEVGFGFRP